MFLDEIGEMPLALQSRLLRVLEDKKVRPLGATKKHLSMFGLWRLPMPIWIGDRGGKVPLRSLLPLATVAVAVPPLRERPADIPLLIKHFLARVSAEAGRPVPEIDSDAMTRMLRYPWPGNARELQNAIQRGVILCRNDVITIKELPPRVAGQDLSPTQMLAEAVDKRMSLDQLEQAYVHAVLDSVNGNKTEAANILRIDRKTLYRKLEDSSADSSDT